MNRFVVFPFDHNLKKILEWSAGRMEGVVEDVLTMEGWGERDEHIQIGDKQISVKFSISEISKNCNSIWIVESYYDIDFGTQIVPVLRYAKEKQWSVFYGRVTSEDEEKIIENLIEKENLHLLDLNFKETDTEEKLYDMKIPVIWLTDMFSKMSSQNISFEIYRAFQSNGYSVGYVSKRKDISLFEGIETFPDISGLNYHASIGRLNRFMKKEEREKDLLLIEMPGNLVEVSRKVYGDYGVMAYLMSKAAPPDIIMCNIPYMDNILENMGNMKEAVFSALGVPVDYMNIIPLYLDLLQSEQMKCFEYLTLSDEFIENKIKNRTDVYNINSAERAQKIVELMITQLNSYV